MTVFLLLFRGVGGATQLPTSRLRASLEAAGFANVATYINSGNAVVKSDLPRNAVVARVAEICGGEFGFRKQIYAATREEWAALVAANPFPDAPVPKFLHAAVLAGEPEPERVAALQALAAPGEGFAVRGRVAYLHTPHGLSASRLGESFDKGIGVANTARNWNTVLSLLKLAETAES